VAIISHQNSPSAPCPWGDYFCGLMAIGNKKPAMIAGFLLG
jgi:hypothetical protein